MVAVAILAGCAVCVSALLWAEAADRPAARAAFKIAASLLFVLFALERGAIASVYGQIVLAGLALCALGDALLLRRAQAAFLAGMAAFAAGHAAYIAAFFAGGAEYRPGVFAAALIMAWFAFAICRWLWPQLGQFRLPVVGYSAIISVMVVAAVALALTRGWPLVAAGAAIFAISDVAVARDRFVAEKLSNRLWGLPAYYAAQLLIASTVAAAAN